MKPNPKYFDKLRIKPQRDAAAKPEAPACEWPGCRQAGDYRAPKGRDREGQFHRFCLDHVREYNKSYNYFEGMSAKEVADHHKTTTTGDRPTWTMGVNGSSPNKGQQAHVNRTRFAGFRVNDSFTVFGGAKFQGEERGEPKRNKPVRRLEKQSLEKLNLDETATGEQIRARYKELVKLHHPDANGGDRSSEDRLRDIIHAYKHLKSVGFC